MIIICGPTATGKTNLGLKIASVFNTEIISADSRQIYKYLNIGTSKPSGIWQQKNSVYSVKSIPYHLVDFLQPDKIFSAGDFVKISKTIIKELKKKNKIPVIAGGTGFYIKSLVDGIDKLPTRNQKIRENLEELQKKFGGEYLYQQLKIVDPVSAQKIHPNNIQRIIRALEVYQITGKPISYFHRITSPLPLSPPLPLSILWRGIKGEVNENIIMIGLLPQRVILYKKIEERVRTILETGMIEETKKLLEKKFSQDYPALKSLGYKHILKYLKNQLSYDKMKELITVDTKHYAKRQITWFKKDNRIKWFEDGESTDSWSEIFQYIKSRIK